MFRKRRTKKMLSADELKTKLYSHLDKTGSLNRLRIELREKLISELLKKTAPVETVDVSSPVYTFDRNVLPLQISNWLVYDHLLSQGYQYTLSIFVSEANFPTHPEKLLAACDILVLLGLDSTSSEFKSIRQMCSIRNAQFPHSLLIAVIKCLFDLTTREGRFSETKEQGETQEDSDHEGLVLERNLNADSSELKESDKFLKLRKASPDLSLHDQVLLIKEEKEKEVQQLRHKLLQELDRLHSQEHKQQLEIEQLWNDLQREKDYLLNENEKLKQKELLMDKEYQNKLEKRTRELEIDFISKMHAKEKELEIFQEKLHEKEQKLNLFEMNLSNQKENYISLKRELDDMKQVHSILQTKYSNLLDENTNLLKKFESMSDYAIIKGDLETKSKDFKHLLQEFEEYRKQAEKEKESFHENLQKLDTKLRIKEPELVETQRQLNLARDTLHMEEAVWHKERKKLEQEVISSREMYQTLIQRIEEQKEDIQALHRTIHILHYQLTDKSTRSTARVEPLIPNRSSFKVPDISRKDSDFSKINRGTDYSPSKYRQKSLKFIEDAKERISKLQQEADALQYKSSNVYNSAPKIPPHAISNPMQFNFTNEQRFQPSTYHAIKPFVSEFPTTNFENLIHKELPTLNLSFPTDIKNHLTYTYANAYKSESSVNAQTVADRNISDDPDKNLKHSPHMNKKSNVYFTLQSDTFSPEKNHPNINNAGLSKVDRGSEASKQCDLNNGNNHQVLSTESFLEKSPSSNARISVTMLSNVQGYENPGTSLIKKDGGDNQSYEKYSENTQNLSENSLQETSIPADGRPLTGTEGNESKSELPVDLVNKNKILESDVEKSMSANQQVSETPLIVDLDAAWKRKSSLKSSIVNPLNRKLSTEITSKEIIQTKSRQFQDVQQGPLLSFSYKRNLSEKLKDDLSNSKRQQSMELQRSHQEFYIADSKFNNSKKVQLHHRTETQSNEAPKLQEIEHQEVQGSFHEKEETVIAGTSKPIDSDDEQKEVLNDPKPVHEDSLSELSEIHLSCGSEQEQQKEDSDNW